MAEAGTPWSEEEIDAIVADYFAMLRKDLAREPYVKSHHNALLQDQIGRSKGSIEYKHQNISAILSELGEPWIDGYKPAFNYQAALVDGIERYLENAPGWLMSGDATAIRGQAAEAGSAYQPERAPLAVDSAPPTLRNQQPGDAAKARLKRIVRKFDPAMRDARNKALGDAGEELIFNIEKQRLRDAGKARLAEQVEWTSRGRGDGAGYDIHSYEVDGRPRWIEVKTTKGGEFTPFHISKNELDVANENAEIWHLARVYHFAQTQPRMFELRPPLERHVALTPTSFRAGWE